MTDALPNGMKVRIEAMEKMLQEHQTAIQGRDGLVSFQHDTARTLYGPPYRKEDGLVFKQDSTNAKLDTMLQEMRDLKNQARGARWALVLAVTILSLPDAVPFLKGLLGL